MDINTNIKCIMPRNNCLLHFVGIGGIGVSGLAEIFCNMGYKVSGSDISYNDNISRLEKLGIKIHIGHSADNISSDIIAVIYSTAVSADNEELVKAKELKIPVVHRSQMYKEIARFFYTIAISGSHGKTTTTTIMSTLLQHSDLDPTVINGGIINEFNSNTKFGRGDYFIVEADESDGTFIQFNSTIGIITNIDPEHLDYYGSKEKLYDAFKLFVENLPFYGLAIICNDNINCRNLVGKISNRKILTYGIDQKSDVMAQNIRNIDYGFVIDIKLSDKVTNGNRIIKDFIIPIAGQHNILNVLAALTAAIEINIGEEKLRYAIQQYKGVKRRFTKVFEDDNNLIIDDYAHHPSEVVATIATAKSVVKNKGRVIAVFQPHRYSRVENLWDDFGKSFIGSDILFLADIYPAGEKAINGINKEALAQNIVKNSNIDVKLFSDKQNLYEKLINIIQPNDLIIFMGAGDITKYAYEFSEFYSNEKINGKIVAAYE